MTRKPPSREAFDKLLAWLDPDREQAGEKYQKIHSRLIGIFSCHGCAEPEKLADETIDRVIAKIDSLQNYQGEQIRYFCGVARNILKEDFKRRIPPPSPSDPPPDQRDEESQMRYDCLDQCMAELPERSQSVILAYYEEDGHAKIVRRKKLAEELGITLTALRLRVFHMRVQLSRCMEACFKQTSAG